MLMQNFKTAEDLGITEPQKDALIKTLVLLETGEIKHVSYKEIGRDIDPEKATYSGHFNMARWTGVHACGTACCIGGTAEIISGVKFREVEGFERNLPLHGLFYPNMEWEGWCKITEAQAATALRSYLTTGDARWDLAVA